MRSNSSRRHSRSASAFTLVELLVVIGIITLLIAILLPSLTAARRQATLLVCASNQRQIVAASLMHAHEHQGYLQIAGNLETPNLDPNNPALPIPDSISDASSLRYTYVNWYQGLPGVTPVPYHAALAKYCGCGISMTSASDVDNWLNLPTALKKIFSCPASVRIDLTPPRGQGTLLIVPVAPYSFYGWSTNGDYVINEGVTGFSYIAPNESRRLRGKLSRVRSTSTTVLLADGQPRPEPSVSWFSDGWVLWTPTDPNGTVTLADAWLDRTRSNTRTASKDNFDPYRHKGKMNVAFLDGHVETLPMTAEGLSSAVLIR